MTPAAAGAAAARRLRLSTPVPAGTALRQLRAIAQRTGAVLLGTADAEPAKATLEALVAELPEPR